MNNFIVAIVACALIATAWARPEVDTAAVRESGQRLKEAHEKCQADSATSVDEAALKGLRSGGPAPANLGVHTLCLSKALGWQNADGSVNKSVVESRAQAIYGDNPDLQRIVEECTKPQENDVATAFYIFNCYKKYAPHPANAPHDHHH